MLKQCKLRLFFSVIQKKAILVVIEAKRDITNITMHITLHLILLPLIVRPVLAPSTGNSSTLDWKMPLYPVKPCWPKAVLMFWGVCCSLSFCWFLHCSGWWRRNGCCFLQELMQQVKPKLAMAGFPSMFHGHNEWLHLYWAFTILFELDLARCWKACTCEGGRFTSDVSVHG